MNDGARSTDMDEREATAREAVLRTARAMNEAGINHGKAGNVSLRWPRDGRPGCLLTPSGLPYARCTPADIAWLPLDAHDEHDADGTHLPSSEWRFHRDIYADRADARAIVHTHSTEATALACLPRVQREGIPAFHYMVAAAGGADIRCAPYATFGSQALSDGAVRALEGRRACLLSHHGVIALGTARGADAADATVPGTPEALEAALALAVEVEALATMYARLLSIDPSPPVLDADEMARVLEKFRAYGRPRPR